MHSQDAVHSLCCRMSPVAPLLALLGAAILDHMKSHEIQDGDCCLSQDEVAMGMA